MRQKPKGRKYRNLYDRGGTIYFERVVAGRRVKRSTKTDDWDVAARVRDLYEQETRTSPLPRLEVPKFNELAARYLTMTGHLAATTAKDREALLKPDGPLTNWFGPMQVDQIRRPALLEWWQVEIDGKGRAQKTGRNYLDALSGVLHLAVDSELIESNPVDGFRAVLRRRNRTQQGRARNEAGASVHPIDSPEHLEAFAKQSARRGGVAHVVDLLQLDAGLRLGEATALGWEDCWFGRDASDTTRHLRVRASRSRGVHLGKTKSGRERTVAMSRRLRSALLSWQLESGRPEQGPVAVVDHGNYRRRHFADVCRVAKVGRYKPKDLRDSFASWLLTCGVQLGYVSAQLGHADVSVTARHYARWAGGDSYRRPLEVGNGEVPADLLARLNEKSHQIPTTAAEA